MMLVANDRGITFNVRLVRPGDSINGGKRNDDPDCIVKFYDTRRTHTVLGQFVSSYYAGTLHEHPRGSGQILHGDVADWVLSSANMAAVVAWLPPPLSKPEPDPSIPF